MSTLKNNRDAFTVSSGKSSNTVKRTDLLQGQVLAAEAICRAARKIIEERSLPPVEHCKTSLQAWMQLWKYIRLWRRSRSKTAGDALSYEGIGTCVREAFGHWLWMLIQEIVIVIALAFNWIFVKLRNLFAFLGFQIVRLYRYNKERSYWRKMRSEIKKENNHRRFSAWKEQQRATAAEKRINREVANAERAARKKEEAEFREARRKEEEAIKQAKIKEAEAARDTQQIEAELTALAVKRKEEEERVLAEIQRKEEAEAMLAEIREKEEKERAELIEKRKLEETQRLEAVRQAEEARARLELMRKEEEERKRLEAIRIEEETRLRLEEERKAEEERMQKAEEEAKAEAARRVQEELDRKAREEEERRRIEAIRIAEENRLRQDAAQKEEARKKAEEAFRIEAEKRAEEARLASEKREEARIALEAAAAAGVTAAAEKIREEEENEKAKLEALRLEAERKAEEEVRRIEAEQKAEAERKAHEEALRIEAEQKALAEQKEREEALRIEAEQKAEAARLEAERKEAERLELLKKEEEERIRAEEKAKEAVLEAARAAEEQNRKRLEAEEAKYLAERKKKQQSRKSGAKPAPIKQKEAFAASAARTAVKSLPVSMPSIPSAEEIGKTMEGARDTTSNTIRKIVLASEHREAYGNFGAAVRITALKYAVIAGVAAAAAYIGVRRSADTASLGMGSFILLFIAVFVLGTLLEVGLGFLCGKILNKRFSLGSDHGVVEKNSVYSLIACVGFSFSCALLAFDKGKFMAVFAAMLLLAMIGHIWVLYRVSKGQKGFTLLVYLLSVILAAAVIILAVILFKDKLLLIWNAIK